jgi:hypothetical protein
MKLADMKALQQLIIDNEQRFIGEVSDNDIREGAVLSQSLLFQNLIYPNLLFFT